MLVEYVPRALQEFDLRVRPEYVHQALQESPPPAPLEYDPPQHPVLGPRVLLGSVPRAPLGSANQQSPRPTASKNRPISHAQPAKPSPHSLPHLQPPPPPRAPAKPPQRRHRSKTSTSTSRLIPSSCRSLEKCASLPTTFPNSLRKTNATRNPIPSNRTHPTPSTPPPATPTPAPPSAPKPAPPPPASQNVATANNAPTPQNQTANTTTSTAPTASPP